MSALEGMKLSAHEHSLKVYKYTEKLNSAYSGGFSCNICRKTYNNKFVNYHCTLCEYDLCDKCLYAEIDRELKSKK